MPFEVLQDIPLFDGLEKRETVNPASTLSVEVSCRYDQNLIIAGYGNRTVVLDLHVEKIFRRIIQSFKDGNT
ncbi:MAG: hypothetical protein LBV02_01095 [Bacteroidales bacterium]|nr:hypothetical protein [Bacteroidales bacterium]